MLGVDNSLTFDDINKETHIISDIQTRKIAIDFIYNSISSNTLASKQISQYFVKNQKLVNIIVVTLFNEVNNSDFIASDSLCKLCSL